MLIVQRWLDYSLKEFFIGKRLFLKQLMVCNGSTCWVGLGELCQHNFKHNIVEEA